MQKNFLHGDLTKPIYKSQPSSFIDSTCSDNVCVLSKSLYGLKQSSRAWFQKLSEALLQIGFSFSYYDMSLFSIHQNDNIILLLIYVNDIILTSNNLALMSHCITSLQ